MLERFSPWPPAPASVPALTNTGSPAVGWITDLRKERVPCLWCERSGSFAINGQPIRCPACQGSGEQLLLKADIDDLHPRVADLIEAKSYRKTSAEIYDDASASGVPGSGRMLRRLSLIGGELPKIKTLADLPTPTGDRRSLRGVEVFCAGTHGRGYSETDLDSIVNNFRRFSTGPRAWVRNPVVIGHEETQPLAAFSETCLVMIDAKPTDCGTWEVFCERSPIPTRRHAAPQGGNMIDTFMQRCRTLERIHAIAPTLDLNELAARMDDAGLQRFAEGLPAVMSTGYVPPPNPTPAQNTTADLSRLLDAVERFYDANKRELGAKIAKHDFIETWRRTFVQKETADEQARFLNTIDQQLETFRKLVCSDGRMPDPTPAPAISRFAEEQAGRIYDANRKGLAKFGQDRETFVRNFGAVPAAEREALLSSIR